MKLSAKVEYACLAIMALARQRDGSPLRIPHHANGIVSVNDAPIGPFSASRRSPPSDRASRRQSARPRPTPGADCAASWADFENGRNSRRITLLVQARPVVANRVIASHRPAGATSRWMRRSAAPPAYLTALSTRFDQDLIDHRNVDARRST